MVIGLLFFLTGCTPNASNQEYSARDLEGAAPTMSGKVISKRPIQVAGESGVGGLLGGAAGGIAGSRIGSSSSSHWAGAIGGAIIGGIAGSAIDKSMTKQKAYEYIVKIGTKRLVTVVQSDANFQTGENVFVIMSKKPRLVKDLS